MATELNIVHGVRISGWYAGPAGLSAPRHQINFERTANTGFGSGSGRANKYLGVTRTYGNFTDTFNIGAGTPTVDVFKDGIAMTSVKGIIVVERTESPGNGAFISGSFFVPAVGNITNYLIGPGGVLLMSNPTGWTASGVLTGISGIRQSNNSTCWIFVWGN